MSKTAVAGEAGSHASAATPWVVFACGGRRYGFALEYVSEILTPRPFTRLPGSGPEVCGLVGVRGRVITVFDLGTVLGVGAAASLPDYRLLLLDIGSRRLGVAVEAVVDIAPARVEPAAAAAAASPALMGYGETDAGAFDALTPLVLAEQLLPI